MDLKSCGFLVFREEPRREFLLMKHRDRWDLPKGHVDAGETEMQCALRELYEETGIGEQDIEIAANFRFETQYVVRLRQTDFQPATKTLIVFLAWLRRPREITPTEHEEFRWMPWSPPHQIQRQTIDSLLQAVDDFFSSQPPLAKAANDRDIAGRNSPR
jgi:bis(5'-nucleosidyl)-tetraphosphatase